MVEGVCADKEEIGAGGGLAEERLGEEQERGGVEVVGQVRGLGFGWGDGLEGDAAGWCGDGAIDEEDGAGLGDVFGKFGGPLLLEDEADVVGEADGLGLFGEMPGCTVVAAEGVAAGEDEALGGLGHGAFPCGRMV